MGPKLTKEEREEAILQEGRHAEYLKRVDAARVSNYEKADAAVLALSSLFLTATVSFLKDIVTPSTAADLWLVVLSWSLLVASIVAVLLSFFSGRIATDKAEAHAECVYLERDDGSSAKAEKITKVWVAITLWTNGLAAATCVSAMILFVIFASINLMNKPSFPTKTGGDSTKGVPPPKLPAVPSKPAPSSPPPSKPPKEN